MDCFDVNPHRLRARGLTPLRLRHNSAPERPMPPKRQQPSADKFRNDIKRHFTGLPVIPQIESVPYRTQKFPGRNRVVILGTLAVFASLLIGSFIAVRQARVARRERTIAIRERYRAEASRQTAPYAQSFERQQALTGKKPTKADTLFAIRRIHAKLGNLGSRRNSRPIAAINPNPTASNTISGRFGADGDCGKLGGSKTSKFSPILRIKILQ